MLGHILGALASSVSLATADVFAYLLLALVAAFLISSAVIAYVYLRRLKRGTSVSPTTPA